jgi:hypothetical protein
MIPGFEKIIEERIKKAQEDGAFDSLDGHGKPFVLEQGIQPRMTAVLPIKF